MSICTLSDAVYIVFEGGGSREWYYADLPFELDSQLAAHRLVTNRYGWSAVAILAVCASTLALQLLSLIALRLAAIASASCEVERRRADLLNEDPANWRVDWGGRELARASRSLPSLSPDV